mgnify:CR=1 FL=1
MTGIRQQYTVKDLGIDLLCDIAGAFLFNIGIYNFAVNAEFAPVGVSGIALILRYLFGLPMGIVSILLNIPILLVSYKLLGRRFLLRSMKSMVIFALVLDYVMPIIPVYDGNPFYASICTGIFSGLGLTIVYLRGGSTGGTDFIALYVSNKTGRSIWEYVFAGNCVILCIFGYMFGWLYAGYSILFQFVSTKAISAFHHRYERVTLQITTTKAPEIINQYVKQYRHGISCVDAVGGYSHKKMYLLHTVVSSYEVNDIVHLMREQDPHVIVNMIKTENFYGGFYQAPIE